jgi:serine/threonine protein kinase
MSQQKIESLSSGRYPLRGVLGQGGMATVYRSFDEMLQVERAIKVLSREMAGNEKIRMRFLDEARTMARLKHANIVGVYDVGMEGDTPFIVMEMIEGGSVMDWVNGNGPMAPKAAAWATIGMLRGLAMAHSFGIVHRDVKPHNLLLTNQGVPKLTDFGIAHVGSKASSLTQTGSVLGTMAYMSPEQRRSTKDAGVTSDVYASGATLYVMLKGEEPFDLYSKELADELYEGIAPELREIIQVASSYRASDRYPSAKAMEDALLSIVDALPDSDQVTSDGRVMLRSTVQTVAWEPDDEPSPSIKLQDTGTIDFGVLASQADASEATESRTKSKRLAIAGGLALALAVGGGLQWMTGGEAVPAPAPDATVTAPVQAAPIVPKEVVPPVPAPRRPVQHQSLQPSPQLSQPTPAERWGRPLSVPSLSPRSPSTASQWAAPGGRASSLWVPIVCS